MFSLRLRGWSSVPPTVHRPAFWGESVCASGLKAAGMFSGTTVTPLRGKAVEDGWSNMTTEMGSRMTAPLWLRDGSGDRGHQISTVPRLVHEKLDVVLST